jgi:small subunit ribosomal protein S20
MANSPSSRKRARRNAARAEINNTRRARMRTFVKKVESALLAKDADSAATALRIAQPEMQRAVSKGIVHKNAASRKISRLSARIKALKG